MADQNAIFQNSFYIGNNFNAILYGIELVLYFASAWLILCGSKRTDRRSDKRFLYLSTGILCMITIYVAVEALFGQKMWIVHEGYPGGSAQWFVDNAAVWYVTLGSTASIVLNLMCDGLLLYRTYIVWSDWRVVVLPSILYIGSATLGILTCYFSGSPHANVFAGTAQNIAVSYSAVVIGLNITCTMLICSRILWVAKRMEQTLSCEVSKMYTGAVALVVESMLPYTLFGIAYLVTLGINHPTSIFFLSVYVMFTCISPQMIILRVLIRRGWTKEATRTITAHFISTNARFGTDESRLTYDSDRTTINLCNISVLDNSAQDVHLPSDSKV